MGLPLLEPAYHPWGPKNSAARIQETNKSQTLKDLEKDVYSLLQIREQDATNTREARISIQTDPDMGYEVQLPHDSTLIIKSTPEGRTVHWRNPHKHTSPKLSSQEPATLPYQKGPPLPPPQAKEEPENPSQEVLMVRLMEIDNDDDSMEQVNLDNYDFDDFREYLFDSEVQMTTAEVTTNFNNEPHRPTPSVKVTINMEEEDEDHEQERHRARNQKCALTSPAHP